MEYLARVSTKRDVWIMTEHQLTAWRLTFSFIDEPVRYLYGVLPKYKLMQHGDAVIDAGTLRRWFDMHRTTVEDFIPQNGPHVYDLDFGLPFFIVSNCSNEELDNIKLEYLPIQDGNSAIILNLIVLYDELVLKNCRDRQRNSQDRSKLYEFDL